MKIEEAKKYIDSIAKESLNLEQKKLAISIIEKTSSDGIVDDKVIKFITPNIKLGFVFDKAPEIAQDNISLLVENKSLNINVNEERGEHYLLIGENYEILKNLKLTHTKFENGKKVGLIDFIYIDPPYNTQKTKEDGNDYKQEIISSSRFVYRDKFKRTGWLNMMNERLILAKDLLSENGVIFISIDDNEQAYLKVLCDEIFGEENFIANLCWVKKNCPRGNTLGALKITKNIEYILCYSKNPNSDIFKSLEYSFEELKKKGYTQKDEYFNERGYYRLTPLHHSSSSGAFQYSKSLDYKIEAPDGTIFSIYLNKYKPKSARYTWGEDTFYKGKKLGFITFKKNENNEWVVYRKQYQKVDFDPKTGQVVKDIAGAQLSSYINNCCIDEICASNGSVNFKKILNDNNMFLFPKPLKLIKHLLSFIKNKNAIVLDFFAGSGTTGQAVMEMNEEDGGNRQFILCTNNENNIANNVTWQRLYRIVKGKGSKNEKFEWKYTESKPYLNNNCIRVFETKHYPCGINENIDNLFSIAKKELSKINYDFTLNNIELSYDLSSLHPYKNNLCN